MEKNFLHYHQHRIFCTLSEKVLVGSFNKEKALVVAWGPSLECVIS